MEKVLTDIISIVSFKGILVNNESTTKDTKSFT